MTTQDRTAFIRIAGSLTVTVLAAFGPNQFENQTIPFAPKEETSLMSSLVFLSKEQVCVRSFYVECIHALMLGRHDVCGIMGRGWVTRSWTTRRT
jgi:hypothetical protein